MSTETEVICVGNYITGTVSGYPVRLFINSCPTCGIVYATPNAWENERRSDGRTMYCPNGDTLSYSESDADRQRKRAEQLERQLANRDEDLRAARAELTTTKSQLTKARNRADRGVCQHCKRSFANVQRHVEHMHPEAVSS